VFQSGYRHVAIVGRRPQRFQRDRLHRSRSALLATVAGGHFTDGNSFPVQWYAAATIWYCFDRCIGGSSRAKNDLIEFAKEHGLQIAAFYIENESGASLQRPELFRLLTDCHEGDILLIEQVDRLSRLNADDWTKLKTELHSRRVRVVALDLPTSWMMTSTKDDITSRMMDALNAMMLDMLAAIARKDYDDRRRRQAQGIAKLKESGGYRGRKPDV
jgi:DNA invertase Pin-like site-specific DNA recombinase